MSECRVHFEYDKYLKITVDDPTLSALLLKHGVRGDRIDIQVEAAVTNATLLCPDPLNGALGCSTPPNPCPDGMCPFLVKLRFPEEIMDGVKDSAERD